MATLAEALLAQCRCGGFCVEGWVCEAHPWLGWPHDDCAGPGMPCSQPIRTPMKASGETFITYLEVVASASRDFWEHVRSLGLKPEDYEAFQSENLHGWNLTRKRHGVV